MERNNQIQMDQGEACLDYKTVTKLQQMDQSGVYFGTNSSMTWNSENMIGNLSEFYLNLSEDECKCLIDRKYWPCQRKMSVMIPDKYISDGEKPQRLFDLGTFELSGIFKGEERDYKYVNDGEKPKRVYDAGRIELSGKFKGEDRDCLN